MGILGKTAAFPLIHNLNRHQMLGTLSLPGNF